MSTLHVYGQTGPHDTVIITGDREALQTLHTALTAALQEPDGHRHRTEFFCNDGEAYDLTIFCATNINEMRSPYTNRYE